MEVFDIHCWEHSSYIVLIVGEYVWWYIVIVETITFSKNVLLLPLQILYVSCGFNCL
jgi:hypothetical protein